MKSESKKMNFSINLVVNINKNVLEIQIHSFYMVKFFSRLKLFWSNIFHIISEKEKFQLYLGICFRLLLWTLSFTFWSVPWGIIVSTKGIGNWKQYPFIGNRGNISLILNWLVFFLMRYNINVGGLKSYHYHLFFIVCGTFFK